MAEEEGSGLLATRRAKLERLRAEGIDPFPHSYAGVTPISAIHARASAPGPRRTSRQ